MGLIDCSPLQKPMEDHGKQHDNLLINGFCRVLPPLEVDPSPVIQMDHSPDLMAPYWEHSSSEQHFVEYVWANKRDLT